MVSWGAVAAAMVFGEAADSAALGMVSIPCLQVVSSCNSSHSIVLCVQVCGVAASFGGV